MSKIQLRRFTALSLVSIQTTVYTLLGGVFLWTRQATATPIAGHFDTQAQLPQFPVVVPPAAVDPTSPPPPVGYPQEQPLLEGTASPQFSRYQLGIGDVVSVVVERPPGTYRLGTGDVISILVERFPDLNLQTPIDLDGNIIVPLLGRVSLKGLTVQEAQEKIRSGLTRYVVDPVVLLSLSGLRPDLNFQAQVNQQGDIIVPQLGRVSVQGLTLEEAQEKIRLGLSSFFINPNVTLTLASARPAQVTISGEVVKPGYYTLSPGSQLSAALLVAGGSTTLGDLRSVLVRRARIDGSTIEQRVDLFTPLLNGQSLPNLRLQDGDAVVIPKLEVATDQNYDRSLVSRSTVSQQQINIRVLSYAGGGIGSISLPNGSTFVDALSAIGPSPDNSNLRDIALIRFDPERGKAVTQKIDGKAALLGNIAQNVPLMNNDVIVVGRNLIGRITYALSTFTQPFRDILGFVLFFDQLRENATNLFGPTNDNNDNSN
ncbi:polysaccharide biosynthesis/export family protein [Coleofasciculus sp. H7-2]|uniref:polysaccharide biosynthesis/export family protein n=1 Tax=Coleofasciculus sp. H7-2 TaxID=3351545 RepID=UPI00366AD2DB